MIYRKKHPFLGIIYSSNSNGRAHFNVALPNQMNRSVIVLDGPTNNLDYQQQHQIYPPQYQQQFAQSPQYSQQTPNFKSMDGMHC